MKLLLSFLLSAISYQLCAAANITNLYTAQTLSSGTQLSNRASTSGGGGYSPGTDGNVIQWNDISAISASDGDAVFWPATIGLNLGTSTSKPLYKVNIKNSLPALLFNGSSTYLKSLAYGAAQTQPYTVFLVFKLMDTGAYQYFFAGKDNAVRLAGSVGATYRAYAGGGGNVDFGSADENWHIIAIEFNGASSRYRIDGGTATTMLSDPGTATLDGITIGSFEAASNFFMSGYIAELIVRSGTTANLEEIFTYLNTRWSVY